jgi:hypothetical protein
MNFRPWSNISTPLTVVLIPLFCALFFFACKPNSKPSAKGVNPSATAAPSGTTSVIPQEGLASAFDASPSLVFSAKASTEFTGIKGNEQVVLTPSENGLKIVSSGDDPQLILPPFAEGKQFILQVVIQSPVDTVAQLFFLLQGQSSYLEDKSYMVPLKPGKNVIYFRLDSPSLTDPLRFDPAAHPGNYIIESITARAISSSATP